MLLFSRSKLMLIALLALALLFMSMLTTHSLHASPAGLINICGSCRRGNYLFCTSSLYYNQYYVLIIKIVLSCCLGIGLWGMPWPRFLNADGSALIR